MSNSVAERGPQPKRRQSRKRRHWTRIITALVVLVGLLVAADFGLAAVAEHTVSQKAREQLDLTSDPNVTVHGFPFTTQAISGEYDHISVQAKGIKVGDVLRNVELKADLHNVRAPLGDLLAGDVSDVTIGKLDGQVKLKESAIANIPPLNKINNLNIEPTSEDYVRHGEGEDTSPREAREQGKKNKNGGSDDDGKTRSGDNDPSTTGIRLSGSVGISGEQVEIYAYAIVTLRDSTISIEPQRLQFAREDKTTVVPPQVQQALLPTFRVNIDAADLPFTVTPTDIVVTSGAVIIKGTAEDVRFAELSPNN